MLVVYPTHVFSHGCALEGDLTNSREKGKDKKRRKVTEKKKKGCYSALRSAYNPARTSSVSCYRMPGDEESYDSSSSEEEAAISPQEKQKILGLGVRDLRFGVDFSSLSDLSARQNAYILSGAYNWLLPSDLLEIGGECDAWMESAIKV